ncbi:MAG: hypothetical protein ABSE62_12945 [Chthoniobacteraceae bacterium]|jgi:hypothetical protein
MAMCALILLPVSSLWADALSEIDAKLPTGKTILTASPTALATAVASAIYTNTDSSITPADIAATALEPVGGVARKDRNTSAATVTGSAIQALLFLNDPNFSADTAAITDFVVDANAGEIAQDLSAKGQTAVVEEALAIVSSAALTSTSGSLLSADAAIGQALTQDSYLEGNTVPSGTLATVLANAMPGITGVKGLAQTQAPQAAEAFVQGILSSGTVPDGAGYPGFAVTILRKVSANTSVDELVAYQTGLAGDASQGDLVAIGTALVSAYPKAVAKVTQGLSAVIPAADGTESARVSFAQALTGVQVGAASAITQGAIFVDPYNAGPFTQGVFAGILNSSAKGPKLLVSDAPKIASAAGAILGQDGDALAQVADTISQFIASDNLPVSSAATYATNLIGAAIKGTFPVSQFTGAAAGGGGGRLNVGATIDAGTVNDLASIADLLANGVITADRLSLASSSGLRKAASEVGALAGAVVKFVKSQSFGPGGASGPVATYLAGTLADSIAATVAQLSLGNNVQSAIFTAIEKSINPLTSQSVRAAVNAVFLSQDYLNYPVIGPIAPRETEVTNL